MEKENSEMSEDDIMAFSPSTIMVLLFVLSQVILSAHSIYWDIRMDMWNSAYVGMAAILAMVLSTCVISYVTGIHRHLRVIASRTRKRLFG